MLPTIRRVISFAFLTGEDPFCSLGESQEFYSDTHNHFPSTPLFYLFSSLRKTLSVLEPSPRSYYYTHAGFAPKHANINFV
jgi:hypothetical protein